MDFQSRTHRRDASVAVMELRLAGDASEEGWFLSLVSDSPRTLLSMPFTVEEKKKSSFF